MVLSYGKERKRGLGEKMHVYEGGGCKAKREVKKDLAGSWNDMKGLGLSSANALDRHAWRKIVGEKCLTRFVWSSPGILPRISRPLNGVCAYVCGYRTLDHMNLQLVSFYPNF